MSSKDQKFFASTKADQIVESPPSPQSGDIDYSLLEENLKKTPEERIAFQGDAATSIAILRQARQQADA